MRSIPTLDKLNELIPDNKAAIKYLNNNNVFYNTLLCPGCQKEMKKNIDKQVFWCNSNSCGRRELSLKKYTFFEGSNLSPRAILKLAQLWLSNVSAKSATILSGNSSKTISAFYSHFRKLVGLSLIEEDQIIGGEGIIVEVDETKLGKRKYHRGHRVDGVWVVVGVERTDQGRVFAMPVENRNAETLAEIIRTHVASGSIVHTDCWRGYRGIDFMPEIIHKTVNHSLFFVDLETGVHTNTVEGVNSGIKRKIPVRNRVKLNIEGHLDEYIWRKKNSKMLWMSFIKSLADIHYDIEE